MNRPQRIDLHHHYVPPRYAAWLRDRGIRPGGIDLPRWSAGASRHLMDRVGIRAGILSLSTPGVYLGDQAEATRWAREVNDFGADTVAERPERFGLFATVPLPDVTAAIAEADRAFDQLRADGIVLLANYDGHYLGEPVFDPLLRHLHERGAVVFVHPGELPAAPAEGIPSFTADFLLDTTRTAVSLILSGALRRYDRIRFVLAHAGAFVPYIADRIVLTMINAEPKISQVGMLADPHGQRRKRLDLIRRFYFDVALSSTPAALPSLLAVADPTHIGYGSDYPFAPEAGVTYMARQYEEYPVDDDLRAAIDHGNAESLFPRFAG